MGEGPSKEIPYTSDTAAQGVFLLGFSPVTYSEHCGMQEHRLFHCFSPINAANNVTAAADGPSVPSAPSTKSALDARARHASTGRGSRCAHDGGNATNNTAVHGKPTNAVYGCPGGAPTTHGDGSWTTTGHDHATARRSPNSHAPRESCTDAISRFAAATGGHAPTATPTATTATMKLWIVWGSVSEICFQHCPSRAIVQQFWIKSCCRAVLIFQNRTRT
eukprot:m.387857 g.387857  ORF g.387857 m.387857 type:complete len:220 (-) comp21039_c1_seq1:927-1586(-)